ncbi:hypothetical protein HDV05_004627 [Chytridiales sp. JEL 0842]|nr:hypothetical protein HDV05_004627 [Chytridiales sp. JEL 0842]
MDADDPSKKDSSPRRAKSMAKKVSKYLSGSSKDAASSSQQVPKGTQLEPEPGVQDPLKETEDDDEKNERGRKSESLGIKKSLKKMIGNLNPQRAGPVAVSTSAVHEIDKQPPPSPLQSKSCDDTTSTTEPNSSTSNNELLTPTTNPIPISSARSTTRRSLDNTSSSQRQQRKEFQLTHSKSADQSGLMERTSVDGHEEDQEEFVMVPSPQSPQQVSFAAGTVAGHGKPSMLTLIPKSLQDNAEDTETIVAIFLARFDTIQGNMIEYQYPPLVNLHGVEYKSLPSGAHIVTTDAIYFHTEAGYGVSAFERKVLRDNDPEREKERGARIRAVGVVCTGCRGLHKHLTFLSKVVAEFAANVGVHDELREYYEKQVGVAVPRVGLYESATLQEFQGKHSVLFFPDFINNFGPSVFSLWKCILLQKRILFFGTPPVERQCLYIFCMDLLGTHQDKIIPTKPLFFVNVADIGMLSDLKTFTACTTESIFASKPQLWDVYVPQSQPPQLIFSATSLKAPSMQTIGSQRSEATIGSPSTPSTPPHPSLISTSPQNSSVLLNHSPRTSTTFNPNKLAVNDVDNKRFSHLVKLLPLDGKRGSLAAKRPRSISTGTFIGEGFRESLNIPQATFSKEADHEKNVGVDSGGVSKSLLSAFELVDLRVLNSQDSLQTSIQVLQNPAVFQAIVFVGFLFPVLKWLIIKFYSLSPVMKIPTLGTKQAYEDALIRKSLLGCVEMFVLFRTPYLYSFAIGFFLARLSDSLKRATFDYMFWKGQINKVDPSVSLEEPIGELAEIKLTSELEHEGTIHEHEDRGRNDEITISTSAETGTAAPKTEASTTKISYKERDEPTETISPVPDPMCNSTTTLSPSTRVTINSKVPPTKSLKSSLTIKTKANTITADRAIKTIKLISDNQATHLDVYFDPKIAHGIETWACVIADWASVFIGAVVSAIFTSQSEWASCRGLTPLLSLLYKLLLAIAILFISQIVAAYYEEKLLGIRLRELVEQIEKIKFHMRLYLCFNFMVAGSLSIFLAVEAGVFEQNPCFAQGRISY